jgi:hypothetical protein
MGVLPNRPTCRAFVVGRTSTVQAGGLGPGLDSAPPDRLVRTGRQGELARINLAVLVGVGTTANETYDYDFLAPLQHPP